MATLNCWKIYFEKKVQKLTEFLIVLKSMGVILPLAKVAPPFFKRLRLVPCCPCLILLSQLLATHW